MDQMSVNFISNFVSQRVSQQYKMDSGQVIFLSSIIAGCLAKFNLEWLYDYRLVLLILIAGLCFLVKQYYPTSSAIGKTHTVTRLFHPFEYGLIRFMMTEHRDFWAADMDLEGGSPFFSNLVDYYTPLENVRIDFHDKIHNVDGFITTKLINSPLGEDSTPKVARCLELHLRVGTMDGDIYMKKLENYRTTIQANNKNTDLYLVKILPSGDAKYINHRIKMYSGSKDPEERYNKYMRTYFCENREKLWKYFSSIHFHPEKFRSFGQEARANMLLYGPPGTGKSAFAYRLAVSLGRHIVSLDLTALTDRASIYQVIQNANIENINRHPSEYIILLEEFDIAVMYLHSKKIQKDTVDLGSYCKIEGPKLVEYKKGRDFELEDLLEILQGPVPIPGSIILATTNKFEEMHKLCPALFRPGRLTPVEFGNMTWKSLQELTKHYFGRELSLPVIEKIDVTTSDIIENALNCSLYEKEGFEMFESFLRKKIVMK